MTLRGEAKPMRWRSLLFTPAHRPDRFTKAWASGVADVVCADLEDAVAPDGRPAARKATAEALRTGPPAAPGTRRAVRINPWPGAEEDLEAVAAAGADLLVLPKVESGADVLGVAQRVQELAEGAGVPPPALVVQLETAQGVVAARDLVRAHPSVAAVCFGAEDLAAQAGLRRTPANEEVRTARQWVALCAAAAGLPAFDMITADLKDLERCRREAAEARAWGYSGKMCIHPDQAKAIHEAVRPTPEESQWARHVLSTSAKEALGKGGVAVVDGGMVDVPVIRRAQRILDDE